MAQLAIRDKETSTYLYFNISMSGGEFQRLEGGAVNSIHVDLVPVRKLRENLNLKSTILEHGNTDKFDPFRHSGG